MAIEGWQEASLGDVTYIEMGQSPPSSDCNDEHQGIPFYQGNGEFGSIHPSPKKWTTSPLKLAKAGDVLFSVRAPVGEMNIADTDACIGRGLCAIRATKINSAFLFHILEQSKKDLESKSQGSTFAAISKKELFDLKIALPTVPEQKNIAEILGSVDEAIAKTEEVISQTQKVKQGLLQTLLTKGIGHTKFKQTEIGEIPDRWSVATLDSLCSEMKYGTSEKCSIEKGKYAVLRIPNVVTRTINLNDLKYTNIDEKEAARFSLHDGDVLVIRTNGNPDYVGRMAMVAKELKGFLYASYLIRIRTKKDMLLPEFLCLNSEYGTIKTCFEKEKKTSAGNYNLNTEGMRAGLIATPPLPEQREIIKIVAAIDGVITSSLAELNSLLTLKTGLMSDLLTGRVRVKLNRKSEKAA